MSAGCELPIPRRRWCIGILLGSGASVTCLSRINRAFLTAGAGLLIGILYYVLLLDEISPLQDRGIALAAVSGTRTVRAK